MSNRPPYRAVARVNGWFSRSDWTVFSAVDDAQARLGIKGDLLEVGAFEGKSAVLIGALAGSAESFHVCDPFESEDGLDSANQIENKEHYASITRQRFEENYSRFHAALPVIHQCLSSELVLDDNAFRFIHIDGSHLYHPVCSDVEFSKSISCDGGVVVFDDFRKLGAPGVAAAVWTAVAEHGLTPLALTEQKMYATWGPFDAISSVLADVLGETCCSVRSVEVTGGPCLIVHAAVPPLARAIRATTPPALLHRLPRRMRAVL